MNAWVLVPVDTLSSTGVREKYDFSVGGPTGGKTPSSLERARVGSPDTIRRAGSGATCVLR